MIFKGFKRKSNQIFFNRKLHDWLKKSATISSKEIKNVLVFLDDISEKERIHKDLMLLFEIDESAIKLIIFQQKIKREQGLEEITTPKDFGWYGKLKSERTKNILTEKYDLLINYSKEDNLYRNLLLLQCKTAFSVGFAHADNRLYDLMINCKPTDIALFNSELKKYLEILNKI